MVPPSGLVQNPGHLSKESYALEQGILRHLSRNPGTLEQESCALERKNLLYRASHFSLDRAISLLLLS